MIAGFLYWLAPGHQVIRCTAGTTMTDLPVVTRNEAHSRWEAVVDGHLCIIDYRLDGQALILPSVRVPAAVEGRGIAAALTRAALDWAREESLRVVPVCPYVIAWLRRHPEYGDVLRAVDGDGGKA